LNLRDPASTESDLFRYQVEQFELKAVLKNAESSQILISDPKGNTYILKEGDELGRAHATISRILDKEVILTEKIESLGFEADVVKVRAGFARNFLIPRGKALEVTPVALRKLNQLKVKRAEREAAELNEAEELSRRINKLKLNFELETGETGKAFGSITAADIADRLKAELGAKGEIDRHKIHLERPLKESGSHEISIKLHHNVSATLHITVKAKGAAEGEVQADSEQAEEEKPAGGFKAKSKARHQH
jgi:large subunit ribosomal protein L9